MNGVLIPLLPFVAFFVWLFLIGMRRRKICPNCEQPLPIFCSPFTKTKRQWWEGGYVCRNRRCEADITGKEVSAGSAPQRRSIISGITEVAFSKSVGCLTKTNSIREERHP